MSEHKFYKYTTLALLLLNVAILAFFLLTKPKLGPPPNNNAFLSRAVEILDLDSQQEVKFRDSAQAHKRKMEELNRQIQQLLTIYFESLSSTSDSTNQDQVMQKYQQLEREKVETTYQHINNIKSILREDQLPHFNRFLDVFLERILLNKQKNPPRPKAFR